MPPQLCAVWEGCWARNPRGPLKWCSLWWIIIITTRLSPRLARARYAPEVRTLVLQQQQRSQSNNEFYCCIQGRATESVRRERLILRGEPPGERGAKMCCSHSTFNCKYIHHPLLKEHLRLRDDKKNQPHRERTFALGFECSRDERARVRCYWKTIKKQQSLPLERWLDLIKLCAFSFILIYYTSWLAVEAAIFFVFGY